MVFDAKTIIIIVVIVLFVLSVNMTLVGLMRGDKTIKAEASKWGLAVGGGREAAAKQAADAEALHSAVANLTAPHPAETKTDTPKHE